MLPCKMCHSRREGERVGVTQHTHRTMGHAIITIRTSETWTPEYPPFWWQRYPLQRIKIMHYGLIYLLIKILRPGNMFILYVNHKTPVFLFQWFIRFMVACFMVHGCNNGVLGVLMLIMMFYR